MSTVNYAKELALRFVMDISDRIKEAREHSGLSAPELARVLKVSKGSVYNWESGKAVPSATVIFDVEDATGVSARWIMRGEGEKIVKNRAPDADSDLELASTESLIKILEKALELTRRAQAQMNSQPPSE